MAITIADPETERLAREFARRRGVPVAEAVTAALEAELERAPAEAPAEAGLREKLRGIVEEIKALPTLDVRTDDEILDYDDIGLPR